MQCPKCQILIPVQTDNTTAVVGTTPLDLNEGRQNSNQSAVIHQPVRPSDISNSETRQPIYTISTSQSIHHGHQSTNATTDNNPVVIKPALDISEHEKSWRSKFLKLPILILSIVQFILTALIAILEIASLAILTYRPTGAGIWCAIPFSIAYSLTFILGEYIFSSSN